MKSPMNFVSTLSSQHIRQHVEQSHDIWGIGLSYEQRLQGLLDDLKNYCGLFDMVGLEAPRGQLLASLKRYHLRFRYKEKVVPALGLGAILTAKECRGQGLAGQLIKKVLQESQASFALLFSDIDCRYYEKFGFQKMRAQGFALKTAELIKNEKLELRPARESDLPQLLQDYLDLTESYGIAPLRETLTWKFFRKFNSCGQDLIFSRDGKDCGFATVTPVPARSYLWIEEIFVCEKNFVKAWASLSHYAESLGFQTLKGWQMPACQALQISEWTERQAAIPMIYHLKGEALTPAELEQTLFGSPDHF